MKRFVIDFILIILIVLIGSSYMNEDSLENQMNQFEQRVEEHEYQYDTKVSKAYTFAKNSSDVIENVVGMSVELITNIFSAIIE